MDADDHVEDDFTPWTPEGAAALLTAGEALVEAVREHARVTAAQTGSQDIRAVLTASEVLLPVVLAYADAQFDLTGNGWPLGFLHDLAEGDDEEEQPDEESEIGSGLSVLSRQLFVLTDEEAALAAGRAAYTELWPEDPPTAATEDVTHIGRALYQYGHLNGWDNVRKMPGLSPTGAAMVVLAHEDLLRGDPDQWPDDPFHVEAAVIYSQSDVYL